MEVVETKEYKREFGYMKTKTTKKLPLLVRQISDEDTGDYLGEMREIREFLKKIKENHPLCPKCGVRKAGILRWCGAITECSTCKKT